MKALPATAERLNSCTLAAGGAGVRWWRRMTLYTRHQLVLVLLLVGAAGAGLAVDHWRHAHPHLAGRLEALDRVEPRDSAATPGTSPALRPPRPPAPSEPVDVNRATESELARLPGVGPALASRIVAARPFAGLDDLRRVRGLRRTTLERLRPLVTANGRDGPS